MLHSPPQTARDTKVPSAPKREHQTCSSTTGARGLSMLNRIITLDDGLSESAVGSSSISTEMIGRRTGIFGQAGLFQPIELLNSGSRATSTNNSPATVAQEPVTQTHLSHTSEDHQSC